ncbi:MULTISPECIES: hypothetical protein [Thermodesulfovibrio]|jgi:hypothetical protein|uniref:Uncharacterized protein n=1 Tax=Thermodesulfovibrio obliviosus TaxID=3118332 RepID=A0AAU8H2X5_9BACT
MPEIVIKLSQANPLLHFVNISRMLCYGKIYVQKDIYDIDILKEGLIQFFMESG